MGPKLDFVREDVPNVHSLTPPSSPPSSFSLSPIFPYLLHATSPRGTRQPARCTFILSHLPLQLWIVALFLRRVSSFFLLSALRFRFPRRRSTTSRRFYHVPRYYAYFTDFYGIPRRLLSGPLLPGLLRFLLALSLFRLRTYFLFFFLIRLALFSRFFLLLPVPIVCFTLLLRSHIAF